MTVAIPTKPVVGDYDLRGTDFETLLVGPITGTIIDADRLVRDGPDGWSNGFPNWELYRCAFAGDTHLRERLRLWCIAFAIAYSETGGLRKPSDDVAVCAGRDAYMALMTTRWGAPSDELAAALGVAPKTYRKLRSAIYARLRASLDEYWVRMQIGMRQAALLERRQDRPRPISSLTDGRGFEGDERILAGEGNFRAFPRGSGC